MRGEVGLNEPRPHQNPLDRMALNQRAVYGYSYWSGMGEERGGEGRGEGRRGRRGRGERIGERGRGER